jgi:hypothetical protein
LRFVYGFLRATVLVALACGLWLPVMPAAASSNDGYRELVRHALQAFDAKQWERARELFQAAHEREPNARTQRGLGMVAFEMEDFVAAYRLLRASLADPRRRLEAGLRAQTNELLKRARLLIGRVRVAIAPTHATMKLDGEPVEAAEELWLNIGLHVITVEAEGYEPRKLSLDIRNGDDKELSIALEAPALAPSLAAAQSDAASSRGLGVGLATPPRADSGTIFGKWWFWAAAAGAVAVGVGATVLLHRDAPLIENPPVKGTDGAVHAALSLP